MRLIIQGEMKDTYHTIIVGGGVAGMTAALYLKRAGIDVCLFEKEAPGGQIVRTSSIENYPGFEKIEGPELAMHMYNQLQNLGVPFLFEKVLSCEEKQESIEVRTEKATYQCTHLVLTVGRNPKHLGIPGEQELTGKGISWCAICDGPLYKNKEVAVIGGGRAALEETLYLSKMCSKVTLIHRRDGFRAENNLVEAVQNTPNVIVESNAKVKKFEGTEGHLSHLILEDEREIPVDGCFEFIGQEPGTQPFSNLDILDEEGYVVVNQNYETKKKNIYAGGDCIRKDLYQIITACSDGAVIAETILKKNPS